MWSGMFFLLRPFGEANKNNYFCFLERLHFRVDAPRIEKHGMVLSAVCQCCFCCFAVHALAFLDGCLSPLLLSQIMGRIFVDLQPTSRRNGVQKPRQTHNVRTVDRVLKKCSGRSGFFKGRCWRVRQKITKHIMIFDGPNGLS